MFFGLSYTYEKCTELFGRYRGLHVHMHMLCQSSILLSGTIGLVYTSVHHSGSVGLLSNWANSGQNIIKWPFQKRVHAFVVVWYCLYTVQLLPSTSAHMWTFWTRAYMNWRDPKLPLLGEWHGEVSNRIQFTETQTLSKCNIFLWTFPTELLGTW